MQHITRDELLEIVDMSKGAFDQLQHAGHVALAFGTPLPATPGRYLDLDLVAMAINLGLAPSLGRENSTAVVSAFWPQWMNAVGQAEADPAQDYHMGVAGAGWDDAKKSPKLLLVSNGTANEIAVDFRSGVVGYFTVNVSDIIRRLRARADAIGIDLSQPFFFTPSDPRFDEILQTRIRREQKLRIARTKKNKRKFAAMNARWRRKDIEPASPRVKDQFALQEMMA
jgi:hypothetical protein